MFSEDVARLIAEQFQQEEPDDRYKRSRTVSRRDLVSSLYEAIMAKRKAGFTFEGIAAHLGQLGAPMSESTLRSYLLHARRTAKAAPPAAARKLSRPQGREQSPDKRRRKHPSNPAPQEQDGGREESQRVADNPATTLSAVPSDGGAEALAPAPGVTLDASPQSRSDADTAPPTEPVDSAAHVPAESATDWVQRAAADASANRPDNPERREATRTPPAPTTKPPSFGFVPRNR